VSCLLTVTLHIVDVRLTCIINITYLLTYLIYLLTVEKLEAFNSFTVNFLIELGRQRSCLR